MKISKINVIPIAVNRFYEMTNYRKLGDILYSNVSNQGTLNVYVIYDWLKTMNSGFMLAPYSVAANNLLLDLPPKQLNSNEYYNWKLSTDRTPVFMEQISIVNKTGDYDIDFSGHSPTKVNDYHINLNFVLNKRIVLDAIVSSNNSIVAIIWVIGALSFIMALVKIIVTLNIILRSNINTINLLKAIWYNKRWIAMRIFIIYLPLIIVAGLLSLPFGYLISYFGYLQLIKISYMFVAYSIIFPQIIYITLVILAILIIALFIMSYIKARRFPVYRFVS